MSGATRTRGRKGVPARISHKNHAHPDTSHWKGKCRESILAGDGPIETATGDPYPPVEDMMTGGGGVAAVQAQPDISEEAPLPPGYSLVPVERPAAVVKLSAILELDQMLSDLDRVLDTYATTKSAVIRFDRDGQELAAVWNGDEWAVEVR